MGRLGERFGKFDDNTAVYRSDDPEQKVHWVRAAVGYVLGSAVFAGMWLLFGEGAAAMIGLAGVVAGLIVYVVWRRRRNRRLTGSPTKWPEPE
jgi:hypothetical protein